MGNVDYSLDIRRAAKRAGMTLRQYAAALNISFETLKGMLYQGSLTSIPTLYHMADVSGEIRITGPHGPMILAPERQDDDYNPPPGAPAAQRAA